MTTLTVCADRLRNGVKLNIEIRNFFWHMGNLFV